MNRLKRKVLGTKSSSQYADNISIGGEPFHIVSNNRGREFPLKAWDDEDFRTMSRAKFVLCPRGDYPWTYRFFEAAMCGATPLVEEPSGLYANFRFRDINTPTRDAAEHNFSVCLNLLTVPTPVLEREVQQLLKAA